MRRLGTACVVAAVLGLAGAAGSGVARDGRADNAARSHQGASRQPAARHGHTIRQPAARHEHTIRRPAARHEHTIGHVVWILMENQDYSSVIGSGAASYISGLARRYGLATDYSAISHPSLPNYIALTSGSTQGISDDSGPSSHRLNVPSIFSQLPGGASRSLEQGMPGNCASADSGEYAVRHNPEVYYTNLGRECTRYDAASAANPNISARFTFVTPNLINDMHDGSIADGDRFLRSYVPRLMATPQYRAKNTVIFIVWDENEGGSGNRVPCIVISAFTHGVRDNTRYSHYSLLGTTEALLGLPFLGGARSARSMVGRFGF